MIFYESNVIINEIVFEGVCMNRKLKSSILASLLSASVLTGCNTDNDINRYNHNTEYEVNYKATISKKTNNT